MLFAFLFSESHGGVTCENAYDSCEEIFDRILTIDADINVSYIS